MSAFAIIDVEPHDEAAFQRYVEEHLPTVHAAGGRFLSSAKPFDVVEGAWRPRRLVLQQWPDSTTFRAWYGSDAYRPWRDLRWRVAETRVVLLDGDV